MSALLVTLGAGTLYTIYLVGIDRGAAIEAHVALEQLLEGVRDGEVPLSQASTTRSFVAVGLLLAIAGAVAFGVASVELRHAVARGSLRLRLAIVRRRLLACTRTQLRSAAEAETAKRAWQESDDHARWLSELRRANGLVDLERACEQPPAPRRRHLEIVDGLLAEASNSWRGPEVA
jgi:hypothetical protein